MYYYFYLFYTYIFKNSFNSKTFLPIRKGANTKLKCNMLLSSNQDFCAYSSGRIIFGIFLVQYTAQHNFIIIVPYFIKLYLLLKACYVQNLLYKKPGAGIQLPLYNSIPNGRF